MERVLDDRRGPGEGRWGGGGGVGGAETGGSGGGGRGASKERKQHEETMFSAVGHHAAPVSLLAAFVLASKAMKLALRCMTGY